jgi:uncharacterized protein (TIGR03435 family)
LVKARVLSTVGIAVAIGALAGLRAAQAPDNPTFEVASVKANESGAEGGSMGFQPGGRLLAVNIPLTILIAGAFGNDRGPLLLTQIAGGPSWIASSKFDIDAKANSALASDVQSLSQYLPAMLRDLLEDHFKLKTHTETRQQQIYELVTARTDGRLGSGLRVSTVDCPALIGARRDKPSGAPPLPGVCLPQFGPGRLSGSTTMAILASALSGPAQQVVVDRTGLAGNFDFELRWSPAGLQAAGTSGDAPSIFTAVQEQLGLKLQSTMGPVDVLVIDHVEHPTED